MLKILCFGDSNTYGFNPADGSRYPKNIRWSGVLQELLGENSVVIEAGCNNRTAFCDNPFGIELTGYKILPKYMKENFDVVILSLGVNDLQSQYDVSEIDFKNGMSRLVKLTKQSCDKVILIAPANLSENLFKSPVFSTMFDAKSIEKSNNFIKIYREIANENDCVFVDLNEITEVSEFDGLHHTPTQHRIIAEKIYDQIILLQLQN